MSPGIAGLNRLPDSIADRLRLPLISAPMLRVSGPDLVAAVCANGVVGAFPTANARSVEELDSWLKLLARSAQDAESPVAPWCPNLIIRQPRLADDLACLVRHEVEMAITSVGSPAPAIGPLHDVGCLVFADVATLAHAEKAAAAGADGLVLLTAGAGGQTGRMNPFAFVRAVREFFAGPIVLAGGVTDGPSLLAAQVLGCDLAYMGTKFIAASESMASDAYKDMLVASSLDDVLLTKAFTGLETNMLRPSIQRAGLNPDDLDEAVTRKDAQEMYGGGPGNDARPKRWVDIWSAGHSVSGVRGRDSAGEIVEQLRADYEAARANFPA